MMTLALSYVFYLDKIYYFVFYVICMTLLCCLFSFFFFFKQKTAYEMRISDWSSDVCSSDLVGPILEPRVQRPFDQQRAKAGAVDEQVALDPPVAVEQQRRDVAAFAVQFDARDPPFDPRRAVGFGHLAQEARIKARIELVAVVQPIVGQMRELAGERRDQFQAIILIGRIMPLGTAVQPEMLEARRPVILAGQPEAVEITGADKIGRAHV